MRRVAASMGVALLLAFAAAPGSAHGQGVIDTGGSIVIFKDGVKNPAGEAAAIAQRHGLRVKHTYTAAIKGFAADLPPAARKALENNPNVDRIEPDLLRFQPTPGKPGEGGGGGGEPQPQTTPIGIERIGAPAAHAQGQTGAGVRVAVIDTGIDLDHPDLAANIDTALSGTYVSSGKTTVGGDDDGGHGTHVAGTIAAVNNGIDVIGVAPQATLISLKVLGRRGGTDGDIVAALDFITAHNNAQTSYADIIHVANMSLGGPGNDGQSAFHTAVTNCRNSGTVVCVAAGNESSDAANYEPSSYDEAFTVSALDPRNDVFASFSNYGEDVDMVAPGVGTLSTQMGGGTVSYNGTSMATPHVAGTVALYIAANMESLGTQWSPGSGNAALAVGIQEAVVAAGECADGGHTHPCPTPWVGDTDGINEPLADVDYLLALPQPEAVVVAVSTDKTTYDATSDTTVTITAIVRDENGESLGGLAANLVTTLDGLPVGDPVYTEVSAGTYEATIVLPADLGGHTIAVDATDARLLTGTGTATFTVIDPTLTPVIHVGTIGYRLSGNGRDLFFEETVVDADGNPVEGVQVDIQAFRDGVLVGSGTGALTDATGVASYKLRNAQNGSYTTTITGVSKADTIYDSSANAADPGFTKQ